MLKETAMNHFGSPSAIAAALDITVAAVVMWGQTIPEGSAYKLEVVTGGAIKANPDLYRRRPKRGQVLREPAPVQKAAS
jgi:hypothetical protein